MKDTKRNSWYCPAVDREIEGTICREYCLAGITSANDTLRDLEKWIGLSQRYKDVEDFHRVCESCAHRQRV